MVTWYRRIGTRGECLWTRLRTFGFWKKNWTGRGNFPTNRRTTGLLRTSQLFVIFWLHRLKPLVKVKVTLVQALKLSTGRTTHRGSRGIALPFHDHGTRRGWGFSVTPRPLFTPGKDPAPIVQKAEWARGLVWTGAENLAPPRDSIPGSSSPSPVAIPTTPPGSLILWNPEVIRTSGEWVW